LARQKERSELEYLRSENRRLKKQLKQLERQKHFYEGVITEAIELEETLQNEPCSSCGKGELIYHDFHHVKLKRCNVCGWQKKL
jgi:formylmethanofuran dehydrogenase subunit E